jgi:hypothetical protein
MHATVILQLPKHTLECDKAEVCIHVSGCDWNIV